MFAVVAPDLTLVHASAALLEVLGETDAKDVSLTARLAGPSAERLARLASGASEEAITVELEGIEGRRVVLEAKAVSIGDVRRVVVEGSERAPGEWRAAGDGVVDLLDRISDAAYVVGPSWQFVYMNRAAERFFGVRRDEVLGRDLWDAFPAAKGSAFEEHFHRAVATRTPVTFETVDPVTRRWVRGTMHPVGESLVVFWRDIEDERAARAALESSQAQVHAIFDHANAGMLVATRDGQLLAANREACRILRYTEAELLARPRDQILDMRDARGHIPPGEGLSRRVEVFAYRGDGTRVELDMSAVQFRDHEGNGRVAVVFLDNTERRRLRRVLGTLAHASELSASLEPRRIADALVRLVREQVGGRVGVSIRRGENEPPIEIGEVAPSEACASALVPILTSTRTYGTLHVATCEPDARYEADDLELLGAIADRAALAFDNAAAQADAVHARHLRDDVLEVVARDLRGPLGIAMSATRALEQRDGPRDETAILRRSLARADRLVADLLVAVRLEGGSIPLERGVAKLGELLAEALDPFQQVAKVRRVELEAKVEPVGLEANIDRDRILQLVANLVDNALRFTHAGGHVEVRARAEGRALLLTVADDGEGITEELLPRLFERSKRGQARRAGAGFGLAIARKIAESHGGTIEVASRPGKGATFTVRLPVLDA